MKNSNKKHLLIFALIVLLIGAHSILLNKIKFSPRSQKITVYVAICLGPVNENKCNSKTYSSNSYTYSLFLDKQEVIEQTDDFIEPGLKRYTKCALLDLKNWSCKYADGSGEFGFANDSYFSHSLDANGMAHYSVSNINSYYPSQNEWFALKAKG